MEVAALLIFVVLILLSIAWHYDRGESILERWARENGLQILSQETCWFFKGPYFWTTTKGQEVYRVIVRDREGRTRGGYVRCGGAFLGMMSDHIDVRWDE